MISRFASFAQLPTLERGDYSGDPAGRKAGLQAWLALLLLAAGCAGPGSDSPPEPAAGVQPLPAGAIRGVCLVLGAGTSPDYDARLGGRALDRLAALGATWISLGPHGHQEELASTQIRFPHPGPFDTTDAGLIAAIRDARARDLRVLVVPTLWLRDELWRGDIRMTSERDWTRWFASYRAFLLHYARIAADERADMLAIGLELGGTIAHEAEWRALIAAIREIYQGPLTYAANWWEEVERVPFWDELDRIGVQFFYPLSDSADATDEDLRAGLATIRADLEALASRFDRPYVFTEVGYRSSPAPWVKPWVWRADAPEDEAAQTRCYRLLAETFREAPRFSGLFWWNWYLRPGALRPDDRRFSPQGKEVEAVLAAMFRVDDAAGAADGQ